MPRGEGRAAWPPSLQDASNRSGPAPRQLDDAVRRNRRALLLHDGIAAFRFVRQ